MLRSSTLSDCQWARSPCRRRSWALCPGRRLAPPLSSRGACQQPRVGPSDPGRTGRLPPRRMGSHAVFLAQPAWAILILYAVFPRLTAAWKRKEETLSPQPPRPFVGPRGVMLRPAESAVAAPPWGRVSSGRVIRFDRCSSLLAPADGGGLAFAAPSRAGPCRPFSPSFCPGGAPARCSCRLFDAHCWPRPRPRAAWRRVRGNALSSAPPGFAAPGRAGPVDCLRRRSASLEAHPLVAVSALLSCHSDSQEPAASALSRTRCISAQRRSWPWKSDPVSSSADLPAADSDPLLSVTTSVGPGLVLTETHAPASWPTLIGRRVIERTAPGLTPRL